MRVRTERLEPLTAIHPRSALALSEAKLAGNDRSLQGFCRSAEAAGLLQRSAVPEGLAEQFRSVNSLSDLR